MRRPTSRRPALAACALALAVGGCETTSTRSCPAFEGHPDLARWAPYEVGDTLTFASDAGSTESYTLRAIERSEAYERTDFGDPDDVFCSAEASYLFDASAGDHLIRARYDVIDRVDVPADERPLHVRVIALDGSEPTQFDPSTFRFLLSDASDPGNVGRTERVESSYAPSREIGQVAYEDVLERRLLPDAVDEDTAPETTLTRVVIARDAGLVEFERSDGRTFTRVPP